MGRASPEWTRHDSAIRVVPERPFNRSNRHQEVLSHPSPSCTVNRHFTRRSTSTGPAIAKTSKLWAAYLIFKGDLHRCYMSLHDRYGDVVRVGRYKCYPLHVC